MTQYFAEQPGVSSDTASIDVVLGDVAFTMLTDRGVFSHGRLDPGTSLLLRQGPPLPASGHVADLGCGAGAIALTIACRAPGVTVWAIDVNERARALTATNAARNGIANVRVVAPEEVPTDVRFATIWSNPPIRIGKQALHDLLERWLARLEPSATAVLVVHKHLGADSLQRWLIERGHPTERLVSRGGYRLLEVRQEAGTDR